MYRLSPGSPSLKITRPRGSVSISSRLTTGSTASSERFWKSPDWASTSSTARPLANRSDGRSDGCSGVRVRGEARRLCLPSPDRGPGTSPDRASAVPHPRLRSASDHRWIGGVPAAALAPSPPEQGAADARGGERVHLAGGRGVEELRHLAGGRRTPQRLLDPFHHEEKGDQQRRGEDDAGGGHSDV